LLLLQSVGIPSKMSYSGTGEQRASSVVLAVLTATIGEVIQESGTTLDAETFTGIDYVDDVAVLAEMLD